MSYTTPSRQGTAASVLLHPTLLALSCCTLASMLQAVATGRRQTPPAAQVTSRASVWFGDEPLHDGLPICLCTWAGMAQSVQQLATGWTVRGSDLGGGPDFPHSSRPALRPTHPHEQWVPGLPWLKRPGVALTTHFHLAPRLKKKYSCTSTPPLRLHGPCICKALAYLAVL
jgi:hypothetical protein